MGFRVWVTRGQVSGLSNGRGSIVVLPGLLLLLNAFGVCCCCLCSHVSLLLAFVLRMSLRVYCCLLSCSFLYFLRLLAASSLCRLACVFCIVAASLSCFRVLYHDLASRLECSVLLQALGRCKTSFAGDSFLQVIKVFFRGKLSRITI